MKTIWKLSLTPRNVQGELQNAGEGGPGAILEPPLAEENTASASELNPEVHFLGDDTQCNQSAVDVSFNEKQEVSMPESEGMKQCACLPPLDSEALEAHSPVVDEWGQFCQEPWLALRTLADRLRGVPYSSVFLAQLADYLLGILNGKVKHFQF